jgi:hypothetical protein
MTTYEKPIPLRTDTVGDAQMDTMVLLANIVLSEPDKFPPKEVLQARDICRLVSTVREKVALVEVEREAARIARHKSEHQYAEAERLRALLTRAFMLRAAGAWVEAPGFPEMASWVSDAHAVLRVPTTEPLKSAGDAAAQPTELPPTPATQQDA